MNPSATARLAGTCDSCLLRLKGFAEAGSIDRSIIGRRLRFPRDLRGEEIYYTLQGRAPTPAGLQIPAVRRLQLWTGREEDRAQAVCHSVIQTFSARTGPAAGSSRPRKRLALLCNRRGATEASGKLQPFVVCTGGEPMLQLASHWSPLCTKSASSWLWKATGPSLLWRGIDWLLRQPKANARLVPTVGRELKLVYPQAGGEPERYAALIFNHFFLQPMEWNLTCTATPSWLSLLP